ncbi:MAG: TolC family protein [Pirellulales bacterium]|nr:TolC family protein [Pirellulales bacterium]
MDIRRPHTTTRLAVCMFALANMLGWVCAPHSGAPRGWAQQPETSVPVRLPVVIASKPASVSCGDVGSGPGMDWWNDRVTGQVLNQPQHVALNLESLLLGTLRQSPRIQSVSRRTSVALERIVQQDAAFDPELLFESRTGRTNDPVGNSLVTGGPPRLIEESYTSRAGVQRTGRRGTQFNLSQELGLLDSNSNFFVPADQGNARLSLSLTQPLFARGGKVYNERLLTQARIDGQISWQEMRSDVEQRIADVIRAYWRLYELRCHLMQQNELLKRGQHIKDILQARAELDAARIERAKVQQRIARRRDRQLELVGEIRTQQARLAALAGVDQWRAADGRLELIPIQTPIFPDININLRDAVVRGIERRPEVRAATSELEAAALSMRVTRAELRPQLTAVVDAYLAGLNGNRQAFNSFTDQFTQGGPGFSAGLQYNLPYGRRAAKSRHREAHHRYLQRSEELREAIQLTRAEIETALIAANTTMSQQRTKQRLLATAAEEETVLTRRWEMLGGDGAAVGTVLEQLLDAQQRRADAEREWVSAQTRYMTSLVDLQLAMGTLLINESIEPVRHGVAKINFARSPPPPPSAPLDAFEESSSPPDMTLPPDMALPPDMTLPPDMALPEQWLPQVSQQQFQALINQGVNP